MAEVATSSLRKYEGVVILHPDTPEEDQKGLFRKNAEIIKSFKGEVNHLDTWGKRRLANPINKMTRGIYFHTTFHVQGDCISELERTMRINDRVLRFTHVRRDDRMSLPKFVEEFKQALTDTMNREKEREAKAQARRAAFAQGREGGGGRDYGRDGGGREGGGGRDRDGGGHRGRRDEGGGRDYDGDDSEG